MTSRISKRTVALFLLIALSISLFACTLSDAVQKLAEPIDAAACKSYCKRMPNAVFSKYIYEKDACYCRLDSGTKILIYQTLP